MKRLLLSAGISLSSVLCVFMQQLPNPHPNPGSTPIPQQVPRRPGTNRGSLLIPPPETLTGSGTTAAEPDGLALRQMIVQKYAQPLYRKPTEKERLAISPKPEVLKKYAAFLERPNTGIFRLVADSGCAENSRLVTASENCLKYTMPGAGNSYSFRIENYRIRHLADLTYSNEMLSVTGVLMHGILVKLGDVPVENVSLQTPGVKYLIDFQPVTNFEKAREIDHLLQTGVTRDGFVYGRILAVAENTTYVLRAIAYQGKVYRAVRGAAYNELDFDKRRDVIVAFRIVHREADGSVTIVWSELSNVDSPKMKAPPADTAKMIRPNQFVSSYPDDGGDLLLFRNDCGFSNVATIGACYRLSP